MQCTCNILELFKKRGRESQLLSERGRELQLTSERDIKDDTKTKAIGQYSYHVLKYLIFFSSFC